CLDVLATAGALPWFRGGVRRLGRLGYQLLGSLRIRVIRDPHLGPALDRRNLPTTHAEEFVSKDARDAVGLEKVLHGGYHRGALSSVDANQRRALPSATYNNGSAAQRRAEGPPADAAGWAATFS